MTWSDLVLRIRALVYRRRVEEDLEDEVAFHLAMARRKYTAAGYSEEEAARRALLTFGRSGAVKEDCRRERGIQPLESTLRDIRYAWRGFRRNPWFVTSVAGTIALGLGLNTALFTLFNAYVLRPLAVRDPYSLYNFTWTNRAGSGHAFSWDEYRQFEKNNAAFSETSAGEYLYARVDGHSFQGELVTGNYFQMLGVGAALGRTLLPEDASAPGGDRVVVLSYPAWQTFFAGRRDILGAKIRLRGQPMRVIGVAGRGFQGLRDVPRDFWAPVSMAGQLDDGPNLFGPEHPERLSILGRIKAGESVSRAEAALTGWSRQATALRPDDGKAVGIILRSAATSIPMTPELLLAVSPLAGAFGLVLVLACANVANMMLARALSRQREIGIRLSLGAARGRLIRQLLTESILLSIPAALLGLAVSRLTIEAGIRVMYATVPKDMLEVIRIVSIPVDWRVYGFMMLAALVSAFLFGLAPAIQATRGDVVLATRGEFSAGLRPVRFRNGLVISQVGVCTLLLVVCAALIRTTRTISHIDMGFRTRGLIAMNIVEDSRRRLVEALASDAGVHAMAAAGAIPLGGLPPSLTASRPHGFEISSYYNYVSPKFFDLFEIPIVRGRNFTPEEANSGSAVAILSEGAAQRLFAKTDVLGQLIHVTEKPARDVRVIGVAADIVTCCLALGKDAALVYLPATPSMAGQSLVVRVRGDAEVERSGLDARMGAMAPGAIEDIHSLDQYLALASYPFRIMSLIGLVVAGLALLLTVSGIYGVLSYLVTQRTKEIGIRVTLGATADSVTGLILKQSLRLAAIGAAVGLPLALGLTSLVASRFVFMRALDVPASIVSLVLVSVAALLAGYIPSRRAARIDPIQTLRYD